MKWFCVCLTYLICSDVCSCAKAGPRFQDQRADDPSVRCDNFSKFARFQPYSVVNETWKIFFHWGSKPGSMEYKFRVPSARDTKRLHDILDGNVEVPVNWTARQLIIRDSHNKTSLLVENNDRGQYYMYRVFAVFCAARPSGGEVYGHARAFILYCGVVPGELIHFTIGYLRPPPLVKGSYSPGDKKSKEKVLHMDIRLKQKSGYIGIMFCNNTNAYVLARKSAVPRRNQIPDAVATMDIRMRGGMSYLYQGHHWMPVGEADDERYFMGDDADSASDINELMMKGEHEEIGDMYDSKEDVKPVMLNEEL